MVKYARGCTAHEGLMWGVRIAEETYQLEDRPMPDDWQIQRLGPYNEDCSTTSKLSGILREIPSLLLPHWAGDGEVRTMALIVADDVSLAKIVRSLRAWSADA